MLCIKVRAQEWAELVDWQQKQMATIWWSINLVGFFCFVLFFWHFKVQLFNCLLLFQSYVIRVWKYSEFRPLSEHKTFLDETLGRL